MIWMYYEDYITKTKNQIDDILNNISKVNRFKQKVICITTKEEFASIKDAGIKYNINPSSITKNCTGVYKTAEKLSDGTKLTWMYRKDYLKLSEVNNNVITS